MQCNWGGTDFFVAGWEIAWNTTTKCEHKLCAVCSWLSLWFYCVEALESFAVFELME